MNAQQVATELGVTERTIRRWIARGDLKAEKRGRELVIDIDAARLLTSVQAPEAHVYQDALAEALMMLRGLGYESDAVDIERRFGLVYLEPRARVALAAGADTETDG